MSRAILFQGHLARLHRFKEWIANQLAYACPALCDRKFDSPKARCSLLEAPLFQLEPMEPRLLLSGDMALGSEFNLYNQQDPITRAEIHAFSKNKVNVAIQEKEYTYTVDSNGYFFVDPKQASLLNRRARLDVQPLAPNTALTGGGTAQAQLSSSSAATIYDGHNGSASFNFDGSADNPYGLFDLTYPQVSYESGFPDTSMPLHHASQQWYWYSLNGGPVKRLDSNPIVVGPASIDTDSDGMNDTVSVRYMDGNILLQVTYELLVAEEGGMFGDIGQAIQIINLGSSAASIDLYDFRDYTLSHADDSVHESSEYPDYGLIPSDTGQIFN